MRSNGKDKHKIGISLTKHQIKLLIGRCFIDYYSSHPNNEELREIYELLEEKLRVDRRGKRRKKKKNAVDKKEQS